MNILKILRSILLLIIAALMLDFANTQFSSDYTNASWREFLQNNWYLSDWSLIAYCFIIIAILDLFIRTKHD